MMLPNAMAADSLERRPIEDVLHEIATARYRPDAAIMVCLVRFEEVAPVFLEKLRAAARGDEITDEDANLLLYGLHILGAHREKRAFEPLMLFLRRGWEDVDRVLSDAITESLSKVVASVYDGDAGPLFENISNTAIDEFVRQSLFDAATFLTFERRIERSRMEAFLRRFHAERLAPIGDFAWYGFACAVAFLNWTALVPLVEQAIREEWISPGELSMAEFTRDLREAERAPDDRGRLEKNNLGYLDDVLGALRFFAAAEERDDSEASWSGTSQPIINPWRHVGRNDPCPCGSHRKAKRCCLAA
jgi:uncharacterized protein